MSRAAAGMLCWGSPLVPSAAPTAAGAAGAAGAAAAQLQVSAKSVGASSCGRRRQAGASCWLS